MFPDFLGIGAQKSGTTWLHRNLQTNPQIWMPRKEVHYFDKKIHERFSLAHRLFGDRPQDKQWRKQVRHWLKVHLLEEFSPRDLAWDFKYYLVPPSDRWYASIFEPKKGRKTGEITPAYSALGKDMVAHVHGLMPHAKIIFMIRNPIERDWSQTVMSFDKLEKGSVESASEEVLVEQIDRRGSRRLTKYLRTLENWSTFYPEEQIFVGFLEDISFAPGDLLERLCGFLGVAPHVDAEILNKKIHTRSVGRIPTRVAARLARIYHDELEQLHECFGGYASFWLYCAGRLIDDPPAGESLPYPLWESTLWEEWTSGAPADHPPRPGSRQIQSGPLASVRVAG